MVRRAAIAATIFALLVAPATLSADDEMLAAIQQAINDKGLHWTAGPAFFSPAKFRSLLGMRLTGGENRVCLPEDEGRARDLPSSLNYVTQGAVTSVKYQENCGGCWAFATVAALESAAIREGGFPLSIDLSEQFLLSCDSGESGCEGSYGLDQPMDFLCSNGTVEESCFPFKDQNWTCSPCSDYEWNTYTGTAYGDVDYSVTALKQALVTYGPIATTMKAYDDLNYYSHGVYSYSYGQYEGGHAVLIVGYDDAGSYFLAKNSWSPFWGEHGYFQISYSEVGGVTEFGANSVWIQFGSGPDDDNDSDDDDDNDDNDDNEGECTALCGRLDQCHAVDVFASYPTCVPKCEGLASDEFNCMAEANTCRELLACVGDPSGGDDETTTKTKKPGCGA